MAARTRSAVPTVSEDALHASVAAALTTLLAPPVEWTTFPAGGYLLSPAAKARLVRLGLKSGWPDILVAYAGRVYGIELKTRKGGLTKTRLRRSQSGRTRLVVGQDEMHPRLAAAGIQIAICRSLDQVLIALDGWGIPTRAKVRQQPNGGKMTRDQGSSVDQILAARLAV